MSQQIQITGGAKVRNLQDVIIGTSGVLSSLAFNVANGVPKLDSNGKILVAQLPNSVMEYLGTWNATTNTPTLVNGTGNQGDVYLCNVAGTVNFGAGPIAFVVGDQVIYSGSIWQRASGATGTVTSVAITESGDSLNITGSPITTSGTINIGFNGTNLQYVNGAGNLTTFPTLITSIGLTMPSAFSVANSPLTANGTIAVTGAGVASQYIRGDGTLADFPSSGGGGSSVSYYLNGGTSQGTIGGVTYYEMSKTADTGTGVDFTKTGDGFIVAFLTDANDPAQLNIPAGNWNYEIYASMSSNGGTPELYAELYKYDGTTFTLIATSPHEILYDGTALNLYTFAMTVPATTLALTDRLAIKLYATNSGGKTTTVHTQDSHLCQIITTFSTGITALNGLTAQVQYFQVGTSGTDFNISSTTATHTFNIPDASATARGLITTGTQTIAGAKTFSANPSINVAGQASLSILSSTGNSALIFGYVNNVLKGTIDINATEFKFASTINSTYKFQASGLGIASLIFNNTTNYSYTFPAATGTIALTSDISYPVTSVFGRTGAVVAVSGDYTTAQVTESGSLYFTDSRSRLALSFVAGSGAYNSTTGVITIPTNNNQITNGASYITLTSLSAGAGISYNNTTGAISSTITQYTDALARAALSFVAGSGAYNSTTGVITIPTNNNQITNGAGYITSSALTSYVPYTGATTNVALGTNTLQVNEKIGTADNKGFYLRGIADATHKIYFNTTGNNNIWEYNNSIFFQWYNTASPVTRFTFATNGDFTAVGALSASNFSGSSSGTNTGDQTLASLGAQAQLNGTGFVKASGTTISYDNSTYLTTSSAATTYQTILTNPVTGTGNNDYIVKFTSTGSTIGNSLLQSNADNVFINQENTSIGIDAQANIRLGFTKKSGFNPYLTYATDPFVIASSSGLNIFASNTFTKRLELSTSGELSIYNFFNIINAVQTGLYLNNSARAGGLGRQWGILNGNTAAGEFSIKDETAALTRLIIGTGGEVNTPYGLITPAVNAGTPYNLTLGTSGADAGSVTITAGSTSGYNTSIYVGAGSAAVSPNNIVFNTASVRRITINETGQLLVGTDSALQGTEKLAVASSTNTAILAKFTGGGASGWGTKIWNNGTTGDNLILEFATETAITARGSVKYDRTNDALLLSGSNAFNIATNGTTAVYVTAAQKVGIGGTSNTLRMTVNDTGSTITGGDVTFATQAKGLEIWNTNAATTDNLVGVWFSTGPHKAGIASGRSDASSNWAVDLRFFTHYATTTNLDHTYEKMRLTGDGALCIGVSSPYGSNLLNVNGGIYATSSIAAVVASDIDMFVFSNTGATYTKSCIVASMTATGGTGSYFFYGQQNTSTVALKIFSNGNIQNTNNSYGAISDARLKENIKDATPKLDDLMKIKVRNYNLKGETNKQIGVISQELEEIFPNMIEESTNIGESMKIKGVKYSVFVPMLIKAIQELKAELDILKNK